MYTRRLKRFVLSIKELRLEKEPICQLNMALVNSTYLISARARKRSWRLPTRVQVFTMDSDDVDHIVFLTIKCHFLNVISFCSSLIFIFAITGPSIIRSISCSPNESG